MDIALDYFDSLIKSFEEIVKLMEPIILIIPIPTRPNDVVDANIGRNIRDFNSELDKFIEAILRDRQIQSETRGLSGTKNEQLRELVDHCVSLVPKIKHALNEYIDLLIIDKFATEKVDQAQINKILKTEPIVLNGNIDKVALIKLRKFTKENPEAEYYEYIREQKAALFGTQGTILECPLDRFGIIPKSAKKMAEIWPGCDSYESLRERVTADNKNTIIIYLSGHGYAFGTINPRADDVTKPMSVDFINRTRIVTQYYSDKNFESIVHLPNPGKLTSVYETYDYDTFFFMTCGLDKNLVSYQRAIGYYRTRGHMAEDVTAPSITHKGYNSEINRIFGENYYRHDLMLFATEFKFGSGMSDSVKDKIKEKLLEQADDYLAVDIPEVIRQSVNEVLPKNISRESSISSYLGIIRLTDEFKKEYLLAVREVNWESHRKIAMVDVFNRCVQKCDKLGAWAIDFKSPKDLFWK